MADGEVALGLGFELRKDIFTTVRMLLYSILDAVCYCIAKATSPNKAEREGTLPRLLLKERKSSLSVTVCLQITGTVSHSRKRQVYDISIGVV